MIGVVFVPQVVETLGLWTPFALQYSQIASRTTLHSVLSPNEATRHLLKQLSIRLLFVRLLVSHQVGNLQVMREGDAEPHYAIISHTGYEYCISPRFMQYLIMHA